MRTVGNQQAEVRIALAPVPIIAAERPKEAALHYCDQHEMCMDNAVVGSLSESEKGYPPLGLDMKPDNTCEDKVQIIASISSCDGKTEAFECGIFNVVGYLWVGNYGSSSACGYQGKALMIKPSGWIASATGELLCVSSTF